MERSNISACLNLSSSSAEDLELYMRSGLDSWMYLVFLPITSVFGIFLNLSFVYVVWKVIEMRNKLNVLLVNLAIADVLFLATSFSWKFAGSLGSPLDINFDQSVLGLFGCRVTILLNDLFSFASLFFVTFIAVERYYAVCRPFQHLHLVGRRRMAVLCGFVWGSAMLFAVLLLPAHWTFTTTCIVWPETAEGFPSVVGRCSSTSRAYDTASLALLTLPFFLSLFLNFFIYSRILFKLHRRKHHVIGDEPSCRKQMNAASSMLMVNGLVFFGCNSPFNVTAVSFFVLDACGLPLPNLSTLLSLSRYLFYLNSAINPLIYGVTNYRYRASFQLAFKCTRPFTPERLNSRAIGTSTPLHNNRVLVVNFTNGFSRDDIK